MCKCKTVKKNYDSESIDAGWRNLNLRLTWSKIEFAENKEVLVIP